MTTTSSAELDAAIKLVDDHWAETFGTVRGLLNSMACAYCGRNWAPLTLSIAARNHIDGEPTVVQAHCASRCPDVLQECWA